MRKGIPFFKMSACGNDFCLIDNRQGQFPAPPGPVVRDICSRRTSLGADGLILVDRSDCASFMMRFFNADGGEVEMCGNGSRCVARFAYLNRIAHKQMSFETKAGIVQATLTDKGVSIGIGEVRFSKEDSRVCLDDLIPFKEIYYSTVGVPHVVAFVEDLDGVDVEELGRKIRYHDRFKPEGTNANFVKITGPRSLNIRTYERGVEGETLACGTGSVASAIVASSLGLMASPVKVMTRSGCPLWIDFKRDKDIFMNICLEGEARVICTGDIWLDEIKSPVYV